MMIKRIGKLEHIMANLIQNNKHLEERLDSHGVRLYTLENINIPQQKKKRRDSSKTPPGSPPHQPPPPPPLAGPSRTSRSPRASRSSQVPPPPPLPPSTNQEGQSHGSIAPRSSKTAASAEYKDWTTTDTRLRRHNVSKPLPLGGPPDQVTIQSDFFFNKDLEYLRYGSKGSRHAFSISKMKVAYYPNGDRRAVRIHIADLNEHIIVKRDFKYLYPSDFEDLYLLNLQGHLNHLPPKDKKILTTAVNLWTRHLVIRQRVETSSWGLKATTLSSTLPNLNGMPRALNTSMTTRDGTLHQINEALDYQVKEFKVNMMNPGLKNRQGTESSNLLLYVDDIVLTTSFEVLLQQIIGLLHQGFSMTDIGLLNYFMGNSVVRDSSRMFLSQSKYASDILERAHMVGCNPSQNPVATESKLGADGDPVRLYMYDPRQPHFLALKRILSAKAEYHGVANGVAETRWLRIYYFSINVRSI
nr:ribonuclease H-like domain-containing protein [Tanacetum cinerariifolium]